MLRNNKETRSWRMQCVPRELSTWDAEETYEHGTYETLLWYFLWCQTVALKLRWPASVGTRSDLLFLGEAGYGML